MSTMSTLGWWNVYRDGRISGPHFSEAPSGNVSAHRSREAAERAAKALIRREHLDRRTARARSLEDQQ